jgi:hypothetical protein
VPRRQHRCSEEMIAKLLPGSQALHDFVSTTSETKPTMKLDVMPTS